jgi:two-component system phosphate regulon response regulator OmpR
MERHLDKPEQFGAPSALWRCAGFAEATRLGHNPHPAGQGASNPGIRSPNEGMSAMTGSTHILVVDDEPDIRETLQDYLELHGYRVTQAEGGEALRAAIDENEIDLVLLDINMPGEDGLSLARFLREQTSIPVVMLTAAGEVVDRIVGLEMGADDYLVKPVDLRELLARVKAVLRRFQTAHSQADLAAETAQRVVAFGTLRLDLDAHKLYDGDDKEVPLTSMEYDLLKAFVGAVRPQYRHPHRAHPPQDRTGSRQAPGDQDRPRGRLYLFAVRRLTSPECALSPARPLRAQGQDCLSVSQSFIDLALARCLAHNRMDTARDPVESGLS